MTTTIVFQGKEDAKNSSRVLQPPGGGSSNIFGAPAAEVSTPQRSKNYQKSSIFAEEASNSRSNQPKQAPSAGKDVTKDRLFGEPAATNTASTPPTGKSGTGDRIFGQPDPKDAKPTPQRSQDDDEKDEDEENKPEEMKKEETEQPSKENEQQQQQQYQQPARVQPIRPKASNYNPITHQAKNNTESNNNDKSKGGFNPITHEAAADDKATANPHTSTRVKQPPGGASTPLW